MNARRIAKFQATIFSWFAKNKRELPWRRTSDPWRVLVSEIMLQQTQVERVVPKFLDFISRWPSPARLAAAAPADALRAWSGLGYNRRAIDLWRAAQAMVRDHGGAVPRSVEDLEGLPGVGRYTARAVASFAWNDDAALWDTNVRRIFLRVFHGGEFSASLPGPAALGTLLAAALPTGRSRDWHGALMDLGSAVCTSKAPACAACPLAAFCKAAPEFRRGTAARTPLLRKQARFEGSTRQVRGAVLRELTAAGSGRRSLAALARAVAKSVKGSEADLRGALSGLEKEGLVLRKGDRVSLPR